MAGRGAGKRLLTNEDASCPASFPVKTKETMHTHRLHTAALALLSLTAAACSDAAGHSIADVDAPSFVSVSPQTNIRAGLDSIVVTYDKNIFFSSADYRKITLNGSPAVSANVIGSSNRLLVMAGISRGKSYELVIPEGVVTGPNRMAAR